MLAAHLVLVVAALPLHAAATAAVAALPFHATAAVAAAAAPATAAPAPGPVRVAMLPLNAGAGVTPEVASAIGETLAAELRRVGGVQLVTEAEIKAVLSLEAQQNLAGCTQDACLADVGAALGVDLLVTGSIARPGESWLVHVRLLDAKRVAVVAQSDRRVKAPSVDGVVDELPGMAAELGRALTAAAAGHPGAVAAAGPVTPVPPPPAPVASTEPAVPAPAPFVDEPFADAKAAREKLRLATDGQGWFVAYEPTGDFDAPIFAGSEKVMWAQRRIGGSKDGQGGFSAVFWDPRAQAGYQRELELRDGALTLTCGERNIKLTPLDAAASKTRLAAAELRAPRWRRAAFALAIDDEGTYYFVDQARDAQGDELQPHLFVGRKGKVSFVPVEDAMLGREQQLFMTARGRLKLVADPPRGEWITSSGSKSLQVLDTYSQAPFIYTKLGAYTDALGTACEPYLAPKPTR